MYNKGGSEGRGRSGGGRSFGGGNRSGGGRNFGGGNRRSFGGPREMHKATCSDCGAECEVPFVPKEDRPVYCKECYMKRKDQENTQESNED